ncbi:MAG: hypothetical protein JWQ43_3952 [Glaciihabitans sp.]|nr:hypothetical protein [Glaciihabitans sp.]
MDTSDFAAVLKTAQLELSPERITELAPEAIATLSMVRAVSEVSLGETTPQTAFNASWE